MLVSFLRHRVTGLRNVKSKFRFETQFQAFFFPRVCFWIEWQAATLHSEITFPEKSSQVLWILVLHKGTSRPPLWHQSSDLGRFCGIIWFKGETILLCGATALLGAAWAGGNWNEQNPSAIPGFYETLPVPAPAQPHRWVRADSRAARTLSINVNYTQLVKEPTFAIGKET